MRFDIWRIYYDTDDKRFPLIIAFIRNNIVRSSFFIMEIYIAGKVMLEQLSYDFVHGSELSL